MIWLDNTAEALLPHAMGFYGEDLSPKDTRFAQFAFGQNGLRLATLERKQDPLNIFKCACPLLGGMCDPNVQSR